MTIGHPAEAGKSSSVVAHRYHPAKGWQWWGCGSAEWYIDKTTPPGPIAEFGDPVVPWIETWCEPEAED